MTDIEYLEKYYDGPIEEAMTRLKNGEPIQYIIGNVDFYGYNFMVNKNVLIPRFETEELVEKTIGYIKKMFLGIEKLQVIDLGTGSGCIAITMQKKLGCNVDAVDISDEALQVAIKNNKKNNASVQFMKNNMLEGRKKRYDVIISNPPYLAHNEPIDDIVKKNEPHLALFAENDGLYFYEKILSDSPKCVKEQFLIAFEIGYTQGQKVVEVAKSIFPTANIWVEKDLQGRDRFLFIQNKNQNF